MLFRDEKHEALYWKWSDRLDPMLRNSELRAVLYLLSMDEVLREHAREVFNFSERCIIRTALDEPWQTSSSKNTTRLAFNLWNCRNCRDVDENGDEIEDTEYYYTPGWIFGNSYARYYLQAVEIRHDAHIYDLPF